MLAIAMKIVCYVNSNNGKGDKIMSGTKQREELHKTIWKIANDLRGSIDGWDFKNYVLGILFYRYISENFANYINAGKQEAGDTELDYAKLDDSMIDAETRDELIQTKGFFIYHSQLFGNVLIKAKNDENLNVTLADIFRSIEDSAMGIDSEEDMKGLFSDIDVNNVKLGGSVAERNKLLVKLLNGVGDMDLSDEFADNSIDAFGDAYEYLIGMYAANAGKSDGEYFIS
ncbi:MAG: type I restriction-modification system subunit M [Bacteroidaceae bacterium]|nr:type I restriction-modification system subunit M [Bacteroidaceae bacterium]